MYNAQAGGTQADPNAGQQQANAGGSNKQDGEVTVVTLKKSNR